MDGDEAMLEDGEKRAAGGQVQLSLRHTQQFLQRTTL